MKKNQKTVITFNLNKDVSNLEYLIENSCEIVSAFYNTLLHIEGRLYLKEKIPRINSHDVSLKYGKTIAERIKQGFIVQ